MPSMSHLIRPDIADLEPYTPIVPLDVLAERLGLPVERIIKLDANENPYGPSPRALAALAAQEHGGLCPYAIYPDPQQSRVRTALSHYTGQPAERILCGTGADELIDLLLRLFLEPGDVVIDCPPTFGMYRFDTAVCGGRLCAVPRRDDFTLDVAAIEQAASETRAKVLFIASPNNPDGHATPVQVIERLLTLPLLVVVDEAYIEFAQHGDGPQGMSHLVAEHENLVVLRTFSKWAGLAGLRLGYGVFPEFIINQLWKIKQPYNINVAAQVAALASLDDLDYLRGNVAQMVAERARMYTLLCEIPYLHIYPSQTNFLLCRVDTSSGGRDAAQLQHTLEREGILVRYYRTPRLRDCIRISIGRPEQNERVLEVLRGIQ